MLPSGKQEILFTVQEHDAERAGFHRDIRMVLGDKAYSFATKKELPEPGESITLFEQPTHSASYAMSKKVIIPSGQYGAGTTILKVVKKAVLEQKESHYTLTLKSGDKYLLKPVPSYGEGAWLFKNLGKTMNNKYLNKIASISTHGLPKSLRLRKLSDVVHDKYWATKTETPDLKGKLSILRNQVNRVDQMVWGKE